MNRHTDKAVGMSAISSSLTPGSYAPFQSPCVLRGFEMRGWMIGVHALMSADTLQAQGVDAPARSGWRQMQLEEGAELRYLPVVPTLKDYPKPAIRADAEGKSLIRLKIDPSGQIIDCTTARSSGWQMLDEAACVLYRTHGRFELRATKPASVVAPVVWKLLD